jgi:protein-disulfide isomerase
MSSLNANDHTIGPLDAPMQLVEYGSYDCPHCRQALPIVTEVSQRYGAPLLYGYRHFPHGGVDTEPGRAACAAEAAGLQGKFWEMHDMLLNHQAELTESNLVGHAASLGLDAQRFKSDMVSPGVVEKVREQFQSGLDAAVRSTPTFLINGVRHDDYWDVDTLLEALNRHAANLLVPHSF